MPCGQSGLAGRLPPGNAGREGALSFREPATEPLGHGQESPGGRAQQPLALAALGQGPRGERRRILGVTAELGEEATMDRDQRRDIHQHAAGPADGRLERLLGRARVRLLGRVEQRLHRLQAAAVDGQESLRQQQPGTGPDQVTGQRRQPPLNRNPFAAQVEQFIEVLLDQPGGPGHLPGGHRVPYRVIGQPVLVVPGRRVPVQLPNAAGLFGLQAGAEQVSEQVVVTPPAAHLVQRDHEQPGPFGLLQQRLAARPAGDGVTQRAAEPLEHRGLEQERADLSHSGARAPPRPGSPGRSGGCR